MMEKTVMKERLLYSVGFVLLLLTEVYIALKIHDDFVRPYVGDVLVVILIYFFIRIIIPKKLWLLPICIFAFASGVELLQLCNIVDIIGVRDNKFLSVLIGSVFDVTDIICYGIGCVLLGIFEAFRYVRMNKRKNIDINTEKDTGGNE